MLLMLGIVLSQSANSSATGHRCRVDSKSECLLINNRLRISTQSKQRGCETPNALSSVTMVEEGAAMKVI